MSTFALDVDTASYGYTRNTILNGRLPDPATVRPEEFVNSFAQDYAEPGDNGFSVTVDGARIAADGGSYDGGSAVGGSSALLRVGLQTRAESGPRPDAVLTFVVDVSGSMAEPGRLDLVRSALHTLVDQLRPSDSVAIVAFSTDARVVLPTTAASQRPVIHAAIDELHVQESTNLEAGVTLGYRVASQGYRPGVTNRVILLSDGLANTGDTTAGPILDRIANARAEYGITLLGVGVGHQYGDQLMEQLADKGDGHTVYVTDRQQADDVFVNELPANLDLRARDAKAQVAFNPQTVDSFRLIGYDDRAVANQDFRNDAVAGGAVGPGHSVTALYLVRLRPGAEGQLAVATVRWLDPLTRDPAEASGIASTDDLADSVWSSAPPRLQVDAVAAYFAQDLRSGASARSTEPDAVPENPGLAELARKADRLAVGTEDPSVEDLAKVIHTAVDLGG